MDLVLVRLDPFEELIQTDDGFLFSIGLETVPYQIPFIFRKVAVRLEHAKVMFVGIFHHLILEPAHLLPSPACYGPIVNAFALVRHDQFLADTDDLPQAATVRTGSERTVETEHILVRFLKSHPVSLEPAHEPAESSIVRLEIQGTVTLFKSRGNG